MTIFVFANNVDTTLAGAISSSSTSLTLASANGLPSSIPAGAYLVITLNDAATEQNFEIIYATAVSGATLSGLVRGREGTHALSWGVGDFAYIAPTKGQQNNFGQLGASNTWIGNNTFTDPVAVANAVAGGQALALGQFPSNVTAGWTKTPRVDSSLGSIVMIEQWGFQACNSSGVTNLVFPIPFPSACLHVVSCGYQNSTTVQAYAVMNSVIATGFEWTAYSANSGSPPVIANSAGLVYNYWRAIGY